MRDATGRFGEVTTTGTEQGHRGLGFAGAAVGTGGKARKTEDGRGEKLSEDETKKDEKARGLTQQRRTKKRHGDPERGRRASEELKTDGGRLARFCRER
ncbi:hypothetical protein ERJ75_000562000 [Trypanosoma vivax]|nr:hypothetical protein ERJ75_000562000 [Trypanosoma vivax]